MPEVVLLAVESGVSGSRPVSALVNERETQGTNRDKGELETHTIWRESPRVRHDWLV